MTAVDEYLADVRSAMTGMDASVREDILRELHSHLSDAAAAHGGDAARAVASMGRASQVGREYRKVYGYGLRVQALLILAAGFLAALSSPVLTVGPDGPIPNALSLPFLVILVAYLLWTSVAAGSRVGLYAGMAALLLRVFVALGLALAYPGATLEVLGGLTFALSNVLLVLLGWLPGTAKKAWTRPGAEL